MNPIVQRIVNFWPVVLVGLSLYLGVLAWFWFSSYTGARAVASNLAIGESARQLITMVHACLAFAGAGSFAWFLLAPKRNWQHSLWALAPYVFAWVAVTAFGGNVEIKTGEDLRFCSFDAQTLQITESYDLPPSTKPYFSPKTGRKLVPCAEVQRRIDDGNRPAISKPATVAPTPLPTAVVTVAPSEFVQKMPVVVPPIATEGAVTMTGQMPQVSDIPVPKPLCVNCATVESVQVVEEEGVPSGAGVLVGGLLGAIVGNQLGDGNRRSAATILGAVGGGLVANSVEKAAKKVSSYEVQIRFDDGNQRTMELVSPISVGSRVMVEGLSLRLSDGGVVAFKAR